MGIWLTNILELGISAKELNPLPKIIILITAICLLLGANQAEATVYTLDCTPGSGATVSAGGPSAALYTEFANGAGSGVYTRMYAVQSPGSTTSAQGYNDDVHSQFDQKNGVGTPATQIQDLPLVTVGGVQYLQISCDFGSSTSLTINQVKIWTNSVSTINQSTFSGLSSALGATLYDLGANSINVTNIAKGSGDANIVINIPYALFPGDHTKYVYIWTDWTNMAGGGFAEVAYDKGLTAVGPGTPEAHTVWGGLLMGFVLIGGFVKNRFFKTKLAC